MKTPNVENVYLLTGDDSSKDEKAAIAYMNKLGIEYNHQHFENPDQHPEVLGPLNQWPGSDGRLTAFPIVYYTDTKLCSTVFLHGIAEIKKSKLKKLIAG